MVGNNALLSRALVLSQTPFMLAVKIESLA